MPRINREQVAKWSRAAEGVLVQPWAVASAGLAFMLLLWYWLSAEQRRVERACAAAEDSVKAKLKKVDDEVVALREAWIKDIKSRDEAFSRILDESAKLTEIVDKVTFFLRQCNYVPRS